MPPVSFYGEWPSGESGGSATALVIQSDPPTTPSTAGEQVASPLNGAHPPTPDLVPSSQRLYCLGWVALPEGSELRGQRFPIQRFVLLIAGSELPTIATC